jgi:hypothetical protein
MKHVLMILDNDFQNDPRVQKHINALNEINIKIHLLCTENSSLPITSTTDNLLIYRIINENKLLKFYYYNQKSTIKKALEIINKYDINLIFANDHVALNLAVKIKKISPNLKIHYDAHEYIAGWKYYETDKNFKTRLKGMFVHKLYAYTEKNNFKYISSISTVSEGLANLFDKHYRGPKAVVLRNLPYLLDINASKAETFKKNIKIDSNSTVIVHSGAFYYPSNDINWFFEAINEFSKRKKITLLLVVNDKIKQKIITHPSYDLIKDLIIFHDFVPYDNLVNLLSIADIGILLNYKKNWLSHWFSLPNRIFDYTLAHLAILSTKQPEFEKILETFKNGETFDLYSTTSFSDSLDKLLSSLDSYKEKSKLAKLELNWDVEKKKLQELFVNYL